jgi:predicted O-linked N-acetylglucosamine transferase (SPINDLY family)
MTVQQAFDLAVQHHRAGGLAEAETLYRQLLGVQPDHLDALNNLGIALGCQERMGEAAEVFRRVVGLMPAHADSWNNLGITLAADGRFAEAMEAYSRSLALLPNQPEAYNNIGNAYKELGQIEQAEAAYRRALAERSQDADILRNLGNVLRMQGRIDEAIGAFQRALGVNPGDAKVYNDLSVARSALGQLDEALAAAQRAVELDPQLADSHVNLGNVLKDRGAVSQAIEAFRQALAVQPGNAAARDNLIYTLEFAPGVEGAAIEVEKEGWRRQPGNRLSERPRWEGIVRDPERRLRIGYVSPDFRDHVVGRNLFPLFEKHDRREFEIFCYSGVARPDALTAQFQKLSDGWRSTLGVSDEALAAMIREDGIDLLVDLAQHMAGNRLPVFSRRPAPVQVSFAGYPAGTAAEAIGYRISDRYLEATEIPESEIGDGRSEIGEESELRREDSMEPGLDTDETRLGKNPREVPVSSAPSVLIRVHPWLDSTAAEQIHLIDSFWCYDLCGAAVEVNSLPAHGGGYVTFGSLNNYCKVNDGVLRLWARLLGEVNGSRLVILCPRGSHRRRAMEIFAAAGVTADRIEWVEPCARGEYLRLYHRIDVVLDPFPYNGHTTSLDALWMGVPVVSLAGERAVSRAGLSQLSNLGFSEWVAFGEEEYVKIAGRLAGDVSRLANLRGTLRSRMEGSVLMDGCRFARQIEGAYRAMWREWCAKQEATW